MKAVTWRDRRSSGILTGQRVTGDLASHGPEKRRALVKLLLGLGVALALLLVLAAPALADSIIAQANDWTWDNSWPMWCPHGYTEGMCAPVVDQDPGTPGINVWVVTTASVNYVEYHYFNCTGDDLVGMAQLVGPTQASPYPQLITLASSPMATRWVHVRAHDRTAAAAAQVFAGGYWKFYYVGGGSSRVDWFLCPCFKYSPQGGDPVNLASGTSSQNATDLVLSGVGLPLVLARSYDAQRADVPGPLGCGWTHTYASNLAVLSAGLIYVTYPDGTNVSFTSSDAGVTYTAPAGVLDTLAKLPGGSYTLTDTSGTVYAYSSAGALTSITDRYGNLTTLTYAGGVLTTVANGSGRSLAFTYTSGRITLAEAKQGGVTEQSVSFTYDVSGNLATATDANGHTTGYTYDSSHRLLSVKQPKAMADPNIDPLFTNTYTNGRVTSQTDALGNTLTFDYDPATGATTLTDGRQHQSSYGWDSQYRSTGFIDALNHSSFLSYGANGLPMTTTDANGHTTRLEYDGNGNTTSLHDAGGLVSRTLYDAKNNPLWVQDPLGERLTRTQTGLLLSDDFTSDSLSNYTTANESGTATWSIVSGVLSQTTRLTTGSLTRDGISQAACATASISRSYGSEAVADLLVATGAPQGGAFPGYSASISTDTASIQKRAGGTWTQLASTAYATSRGTFRQVRLYAKNGTVYLKAGATDLSEIDLSASDSTYAAGSGGFRSYSECDYDYLELRRSADVTVTGLPTGYLVRVTQGSQTADATASSGTAVVDAGPLMFPLDRIEIFDASAMKVAELSSADLADMGGGDTFAYDGSAGHRTTFTWDQTGTFLDSVTSPIGTTAFTWNSDGSLDSMTDACNHTWSYDYNAYGDLVSAVDPLNYETTYTCDSAGRVTGIDDPNSSRVQFTYDSKGNVTAVKDPLAVTDPSHRHQLDFTYDANDNVTVIEDASGHLASRSYDDMNRLTLAQDALEGQTVFGWDSCSNLTSIGDPNGHSTLYSYDSANRLSSITDPLSHVLGLAYDPAGNLLSITSPNSQVTSFTYTPDDLLAGFSHSGDSTSYAYTYNAEDDLTQVQRNDGSTWNYTYDSADRVVSATDHNNTALGALTVGRSYDAVSNLTGLAIGSLMPLAYTYDARDLVATLTDAGGQSDFTRDPGGRLTQIATPEGSSRSFTYDAAGNPTQVQNVTGSGTQTFAYAYDANGNVLSENSATYGYDANDRLASWYDPMADVTTSYTYDPAGNLTTVKEDGVPVRTYAYDAGDEIANSGYVYDANGNLTADGTYTYAYDPENQLVQVKEGQTTLESMTYDVFGRRISLTTPSGTTYFHYAGNVLVAQSNVSGTITATYAYSPEGDLVSMTQGEATYYYQTDANDDVVSLTDSTGAVANTYRYDPWGKLLSASETVQNPLRYTGCYYDSAVDLYYLGYRYYSPSLGRFLTPDPIGQAGGYNRYVYCSDNPLTMSDPSGLKADTPYTEGRKPGDNPPDNWPKPTGKTAKKWTWSKKGYYEDGNKRRTWSRKPPGQRDTNGHWDETQVRGGKGRYIREHNVYPGDPDWEKGGWEWPDGTPVRTGNECPVGGKSDATGPDISPPVVPSGPNWFERLRDWWYWHTPRDSFPFTL